jgi:hypothetical protein
LNTISVGSADELRASGVEQGILFILCNPDVKALEDLSNEVLGLYNFRIIFYEPEPIGWRTDLNARYCHFPVSEIWTYSLHNVDMIKKKSNYKVQYMPPGYSPVYDYRDDSNGHVNVENNYAITLVGVDFNLRLKLLRACKIPLKNLNAWSHEDFALNVVSYHTIINTHKLSRFQKNFMSLLPDYLLRFNFFKWLGSKRLSSPSPVEMFRLAPLLSSGMRVISDRSSKQDEYALSGLIDFCECHKMPTLVRKYLSEANSTERVRVANNISQEFKSRFDMTKMIQRIFENTMVE